MKTADILFLLLHFYLGYWFFKNTNSCLGKVSAYLFLVFYVTSTALLLLVNTLPYDGGSAVGIGLMLMPILLFIVLLYLIGTVVTFMVILKRYRV